MSLSPHPRQSEPAHERRPRAALLLPLEAELSAPRGGARPAAKTAVNGARSRAWVRRVHSAVGLISALNLLLLIGSGLLLQHREAFRLDARTVGRMFLPGRYRSQDGPEGVRADIVLADLHSGRLFGRTGALVLDAVTLGWVALLLSGLVMFAAGRWRNGNGSAGHRNGAENQRDGPGE